jgi:hypothetical protein
MVDLGRAYVETVSDRSVGFGKNIDSTRWCGEAVAAWSAYLKPWAGG